MGYLLNPKVIDFSKKIVVSYIFLRWKIIPTVIKIEGLTYIFFLQLTPHIDKQNKYVEKSESCQNEHDLID